MKKRKSVVKFVESQYNKYIEIKNKLQEKLEEKSSQKKNENLEITVKKKSVKKRKDYIQIHPFIKYMEKTAEYSVMFKKKW